MIKTKNSLNLFLLKNIDIKIFYSPNRCYFIEENRRVIFELDYKNKIIVYFYCHDGERIPDNLIPYLKNILKINDFYFSEVQSLTYLLSDD